MLIFELKTLNMYKIFFGDRYLSLGEEGGNDSFNYGEVASELCGLLENFAGDEQRTRLHLVHSDPEELRAAIRSCFKCIEAGGGVVFNSEGEFLAIERLGLWDLPKGKLDEGENFEQAALREVQEETGLEDVEFGHLLTSSFHTYELKGRRILKETCWFEMNWKGSGEPVLQSEEGITDYRWVDPGNMESIMEHTYASIRDVLILRFPRGTA